MDEHTPAEIKEIVIQMVASDLLMEAKTESFKELFPWFHDEYPTLFKMAAGSAGGDFDFGQLDFLLKMLSDVKKSSVNQESASVVVGQVLYERYVAPVLPKTT